MILTLSSESVRNTVFTDEHGLPVFRSETPFRLGTRTTTISRKLIPTSNSLETEELSEVMGRIDWRYFGSSILTIGESTLESNVFLPKRGFIRRKRTFTAPDGRSYRWDIKKRDLTLSLDDSSRVQLARYHMAGLGIIGKKRSACLEIAPEAEHMLDLIVLTFIYVETLRRDRKRRLRHAAPSGGGP